MASSGRGRSIDIQRLCLLVNRVYQDEAAKLNGYQVTRIEDLPCPPSELELADSLQLPTRQYTLENVNSGAGDSFPDSFFAPDFQLDPKLKESKEAIMWRLNLGNSGNILPICFMKLTQELPSLGYKSLTRILLNVVPEVMLSCSMILPFEEVDLRRLQFVPNRLHVVKTVDESGSETYKLIEDFETGKGIVSRLILGFTDHKAMEYKRGMEVFTRESVLDISGMQYGLKGPKKELVESLEDKVDYIARYSFIGNIKRITEMPEKLSAEEQEAIIDQVSSGNPIVVQTVKRVLEILRTGQRWCHYCGTLMDVPKTCSACKEVFYCGPSCQKSHWPSHKAECSGSEKTVKYVKKAV